MPTPARHIEKHFTASDSIRDIVIGMSDGLTVPFALAAGISGGLATLANANQLVVTAGLAEIAAGAMAMGLGGYLAAKSDAEHYVVERQREEDEVIHLPEREKAEVTEVFLAYGMTREQAGPVVEALSQNSTAWVDFMMKFELGLEKPNPARARNSAWTIAFSYVVGGCVPLAPYVIFHHPTTALKYSAGVTLAALLVFGYIKGRFTGPNPVRSAVQMVLVGGIAAAAAFALARWLAPAI